MPFDEETWTYLIVTVLLAFLVIFIIRRLPKIIGTFVYGFGVTTPALNLVRIIFGFALPKEPGNIGARINTIVFVMVCLVLRTAYQGTYV